QQTKEKTGVFNPKRMLFKQNTINLHLLLEFANAFFNVFEKKSLNHLQILVFVHIFASEFYLLVRDIQRKILIPY
ncbi:MAG: hypothetical protein KIC78_10730, partial [Prevotella sp.]|uniref:hypothetical protein n=1 Tax=Prevotella sp. TaxID=59823 RepID=UPI00257EB75F